MAGRSTLFSAVILFLIFFSGTTGIPQSKEPGDNGGLVFSGAYMKSSQNKTANYRSGMTRFDLKGENLIELPVKYEISLQFSYWKDYGLGDLLNVFTASHSVRILSNAPFFSDEAVIRLVINEEPTELKFTLPRSKMTRKIRHDLVFSIDETKGEMALTINGETKTAITTPLPDMRKKHISVGYSETPSMTLWDMKIEYDGEVQHHWPFFEYSGDIAHDVAGGKDAKIHNPGWAVNEHHYWTPVDSFALKNTGAIAGVPLNNSPEVIFLFKDRFYRYHLEAGRLDTMVLDRGFAAPLSPAYIDRNDSFIVFNSGYPTEPGIIDISKKKWVNLPVGEKPEGFLYGSASIYEAATDENYLLGGYGWYKYHKNLLKFNKTTRQWDTLRVEPNDLTPMWMIAAMPADTPGVHYIWAGMGSLTAKQEDGVKKYTGLYRLDLKEGSIILLRNNDTIRGTSFSYHPTWASKEKKQFFTFSETTVAGSLKSQVYLFNIDGTPAEVHDFAHWDENSKPGMDFYLNAKPGSGVVYSPATERLFGINSWMSKKNDTLFVKVYAVDRPFMSSKEYALYKQKADEKIASLAPASITDILLILGSVAPFGLIAYFIFRRRNGSRKKNEPIQIPKSENLRDELSDSSSDKGFVTIFGGLQIVDEKGQEHQEGLTTKLAELLGYLMWYSFTGKTRGKGVTLQRLTEVFWDNVAEVNVKNNRNVSLSKIRGALVGFGRLQIRNEDMRIRVDLDSGISNEIGEFTLLFKKLKEGNNCTKEDLMSFLTITGRGRPFEGFEAEWADSLSSEISGRVIDLLLKYGETIFNGGDYDLAISVANVIAKYEKLSEEGLRLKIRSLDAKGLHSAVTDVYESFVRDYRTFFDEDYTITLKEILS